MLGYTGLVVSRATASIISQSSRLPLETEPRQPADSGLASILAALNPWSEAARHRMALAPYASVHPRSSRHQTNRDTVDRSMLERLPAKTRIEAFVLRREKVDLAKPEAIGFGDSGECER